jgi:hypothetical protein
MLCQAFRMIVCGLVSELFDVWFGLGRWGFGQDRAGPLAVEGKLL